MEKIQNEQFQCKKTKTNQLLYNTCYFSCNEKKTYCKERKREKKHNLKNK